MTIELERCGYDEDIDREKERDEDIDREKERERVCV